MVLIHYKKTETNQFLYETPANTSIEVVLKELVEINNMRIVLDRLAVSIEDLAQHGPLRPEDTRGLSNDELIDAAIETMTADKKPWAKTPYSAPQGYRLNPDQQAYRTGVILPEDLTNMMIKNCAEVKQGISHKLVDQKRCLNVKIVRELFDTLKGVMMIAYPGYHGLPPWEPTITILEGQFDPDVSQSDAFEYLQADKAALWWAGKELLPGKILSDYSGKNEKTKIIVKLQKQGAGAPVREPAVDAETQKKMMAYYYKKQEEQKQVEQDNDDNYLNAPWANPKNLKNQLHGGQSNISWKPR